MQSTCTIGLILPVYMEYARHILEGISEWAHAHPDIHLNLIAESGAVPDWKTFSLKPDGIIAFTPAADLESVFHLCPAVVSTSNRDLQTGADFVVTDDHAVGRMAAEHFLRRGFRDLVFFGRSDHHYSRERQQGFAERAQESGLRITAYDFQNEAGAYGQVNQLRPKSGVFVANDTMARLLMEHIENPIQRIPVQFAMLGVDNDVIQRSLCPLPLSSIEPNGHAVGYRAMNRLMERIKTPHAPFQIERVLPLAVHTRQSTDLYALEDELAAQTLEVMDEFLPTLKDVSDLVDRLNVPRRTLEHRFRKATGRTLAKELATLRIERARDLLRNTDWPVEQIALEVGLPEARMLWLLFKRHTSESPRDYRQRIL